MTSTNDPYEDVKAPDPDEVQTRFGPIMITATGRRTVRFDTRRYQPHDATHPITIRGVAYHIWGDLFMDESGSWQLGSDNGKSAYMRAYDGLRGNRAVWHQSGDDKLTESARKALTEALPDIVTDWYYSAPYSFDRSGATVAAIKLLEAEKYVIASRLANIQGELVRALALVDSLREQHADVSTSWGDINREIAEVTGVEIK